MNVILFFIVLFLAAPIILFGSPLIIYVLPFILIGLGMSIFADHIRHQERAIKR